MTFVREGAVVAIYGFKNMTPTLEENDTHTIHMKRAKQIKSSTIPFSCFSITKVFNTPYPSTHLEKAEQVGLYLQSNKDSYLNSHGLF